MKCPNCGFESDGRFCRICGCQMPNAPQAQPPFTYSDTPDKTQANQAPAYNFQNPLNPYMTQNMQANPLPPVPPVGNENMNGNMPAGMPVPPFEVPNNAKSRKGGKKALNIVLLSIIAAVIISGISIAVYSACTYDESILSILMNTSQNNYVSDDYIEEEPYYKEDLYYEGSPYFEDSKIHQKGDTVELLKQNITLTDYKTGEFENDSTYSEYTKLDVTFEFENTSDSDYLLPIYQFSAYNAYDTDEYDDDEDYVCEITAVDGNTNTSEIAIAAGETKKFTLSFAVAKDIDTVEIYYSDYSIFDNEGTENPDYKYTACYYQIDEL